MARFSLVRFSVVAAMLAAVWDLRRLAVSRWAASPFSRPTAAGFVVDETSEAGVISRGWSAPPAGWVLKGPSRCLAATNMMTGAFVARLTGTRPRACQCRPVRFGRGQEPRASGVSTTRSIVNSNINSPDVVADSGLCPAIGRDGPLHGGRIRPRATFCHGKLPWSLSIIFSFSRRMCHRRLEPVPAQAVVWPWVRERECTSGQPMARSRQGLPKFLSISAGRASLRAARCRCNQ